MNRRQKLMGIALLGLLLFIVFFAREVDGRERTIRGAEGEQTWDLMDMEQRVEFRALYGNQIGHCFKRGDFAKDLTEERDAGKTEKEHLDLMRSNYEASKTDGGKPIAHHVYVDFQRMVRDIHRTDGSGYVWKDGDIVWEREVWWCAFSPR